MVKLLIKNSYFAWRECLVNGRELLIELHYADHIQVEGDMRAVLEFMIA